MLNMHFKFPKKFILYISIFISSILMLFSGNNDYYLHILSILIVVFASCLTVKFDIINPLCLYVGSVALYSVGYAILYSADFSEVITRYGYNKETLVYLWFSIVLMTLILPSKTIKIASYCLRKKSYIQNYEVTYYLSIFLSIFTYIGIIYLKISGFENKGDIYQNGGMAINLLAKAIYFNLFFYTYHLLFCLLRKLEINKRWMFLSFGSIALFGLITGERDYFFHVILTTFLVFYSVGRIKKRMLPVYAIIGVFLIVLSKIFKYALLSGISDDGSNNLAQGGLFLQFLDGEFVSAGRNMQILVSGGYENYFGGLSLVIDVARIFYDFGFSSQRWFNDTVLDYVSTGYGFTLVGEGFINGGIIGIFIVVYVSSVILRWLYLKSSNSFVCSVLYFYMLPQFIYATRADITNILSPLLKHALASLLILYLIDKFFLSKKKNI